MGDEMEKKNHISCIFLVPFFIQRTAEHQLVCQAVLTLTVICCLERGKKLNKILQGLERNLTP